MNKNLSIVSQNNKLMLKKSKSLMAITNSILSKDDWIQGLWDWADENNVLHSELIDNSEIQRSFSYIPKNKDQLLNMTKLALGSKKLIDIPNEIGKLVNLYAILLTNNELIQLPKSICDLHELIGLALDKNKLVELPKDIVKLEKLLIILLSNNRLNIFPKEILALSRLRHLDVSENRLTNIPSSIDKLINLRKFRLSRNHLISLPDEIVNLKKLEELDIHGNLNLILTRPQMEWLHKLIENGCDVIMDDSNQDLYSEYLGEIELQRRYDYLDEFNIGREVPITPEILDECIPPSITNKLANGEIIFEEYLDEASDYLVYLNKNKFYKLVPKIYDRYYDLGACFEHNISFVSYIDDKLTWTSTAFGEDEKLLITHWSIINMFVKEIFGQETKIVNIAVTID